MFQRSSWGACRRGQSCLEVFLALKLEGDGVHGHVCGHVVFEVVQHLVQTHLLWLVLLAEGARKGEVESTARHHGHLLLEARELRAEFGEVG